jgi:hypothetical protein
MKRRVYPARAALVLAVTVIAAGCGLATPTTAVPSPIASLTQQPVATPTSGLLESVMGIGERYAPNCEGSGGQWKCWGHPSGNTYYGLNTYGSSASKMRRVAASYSTFAPSTPDEDAAVAFFEEIATLPYRGAEPTQAAQWVQSTWDDAKASHHASTRIGAAQLTLLVDEDEGGATYSIEIKAADQSLE